MENLFAMLTENDICFGKSFILYITIMIMPILLFEEKVLLKLRRRFEILFVIISLQTICQSGPLLSMLHSDSKNLIFQHLSLSMNMPI